MTKILRIVLPLSIYVIGFCILLNYTNTYDYLNYCDITREFTLFKVYAGLESTDVSGWMYSLQKSCLFTTIIPATFYFGGNPELFYTLYICLIVSCLPVVNYYIARACKLNEVESFITAVFTMFWVVFYQSPSMSRTPVALLMFALIVLAILKNYRHKNIVIPVLCVCIVFTHYTTTFIVIGLLVMLLVYRVIKREKFDYVAISLITMLVCAGVWYGVFNDRVIFGLFNAGDKVVTNGVPHESTLESYNYSKFSLAVFGRDMEYGGVFKFNIPMLVTAWLTVMMMGVGLLSKIKTLFNEHGVLIAGMMVATLLALLVPALSAIYGAERVYYQLLIVISPFYIIGFNYLFKKWHYFISIPLTVVYGYYMMNYGIIHSLIGG